MKPIYTPITLEEAAKILNISKKTLQNYLAPKLNKVPRDCYYRNALGQIRFKKEKLL